MNELTQIEAPAPESGTRTAHSAHPAPGVFYARVTLRAFLTDHTDRSPRYHLGMRFGVQQPDLLLTPHETLTFAIVVAERKTSRLATLNRPRIVIGTAGKVKLSLPVIHDRALWFTLTPATVKRLIHHCPLRWALVADCDGETWVLLKGEIHDFDKYPGVSARKLALPFSPRPAGGNRGSTRDHRVRPGALPILNT